MAVTTLVFDCAAEEVVAVSSALQSAGAQVQGSERQMLDGSTATAWVMVATTAITAAPAMLNALKDFLRRDAVTSVSVGGVTITNPRPEDVERILAQLPDR
jgi:hypothetical protein